MTCQHRAFTLIELLVVISIVAVLAGMLLPAISQIKGSADRATCASSLRQIAMGWYAYAEDNEGLQPPSVGPTGHPWGDYMGSYVDGFLGEPATPNHLNYNPSGVLWGCPTWRRNYYSRIVGPPHIGYVTTSYAVNYYPACDGSGTGHSKASSTNAFSVASITNKSTRCIAADSVGYLLYDKTTAPQIDGFPAVSTAAFLTLGLRYESGDPRRHGPNANYAFYDGHVGSVPAAQGYLTVWDPVHLP